jgi:hypothetical protein
MLFLFEPIDFFIWTSDLDLQIMEQVEGGDLIVNRGEESRPKETAGVGRDLSAVDGYEAAFKLAQV